jgi:predicted negative regulator of RcsB-dependent stress response
MAKPLNLDEQEQLADIKHFWTKYGNLITGVLTVTLLCVASWYSYQAWRNNQSVQASALYAEVERSVQADDSARMDLSLAEMKNRFASTIYAQQAGLLVAKTQFDKGNLDAAKAALTWLAQSASDEGYKSIARLRLAGLLIESKSYDQALELLSTSIAADFQALAADRRGDVFALQGKKTEAKLAYETAYKGLDERAEYRRLVEVKLNALGEDPTLAAKANASALTEAKK